MRTNFRNALLITAVLLLITVSPALAKGNFTFLIVSGDTLPGDLLLTDPTLTADFFGFADFMHARTIQPASPGIGYEITRYYVDRGRRQVFDHLHYYPSTGYVYYDGMVNGWSEYDGKWYVARANMRTPFEKDVQIASLAEALRHKPFMRRS